MKYFVTSDIHSHYQELVIALKNAGYDINNDEHVLIVCGDIFDRGCDPLEVYNYLRKIPKKRRILIKGNHDYLFIKTFYKDAPTNADYIDGVIDSMCLLSNKEKDYPFSELKEESIIKEIINWFESDEWISYYEIDKYIFTHSFIPLRFKDSCHNLDDPDIYSELYYDDNWRNIKDKFLLERSAFDSSWRKIDAGLFKKEAENGKILVCGHTHSYEFFQGLDHKEYNNKDYDYGIYFGKNVINLDGFVEKSGIINVLVINT